MKNIVFLVLSNCFLFHCVGQARWQQKADFTIDVTLNDKDKTLDGFERITYTNNSPDTLRFIWVHLWPNAYKNDRTALSDDLLSNGNTAFYFASAEQRGYINRLNFKVDGQAASTEDHPEHIDITKVLLPKPLAPGQQAVITTPFHVKLPFNFSRGGYDGESFQLTQWYPKPAVYDAMGWHPMPYLNQGEFYSDFGTYDVRITLPKEYVVAATGSLQNADEKAWLKTRENYSAPAPVKTPKQPYGRSSQQVKAAVKPVAPASQGNKTLHFLQTTPVTDFALFADKNFIVKTDTAQLPSGGTIDVAAYYTPAQQGFWKDALTYAKDALRFYSAEVGDYSYNTATVVQGPSSFGGGMEYPTITIISPLESAMSLDGTIAHELGHNWFYGLLATNERQHPWMDEGMNSFYDAKYLAMKYGVQPKEAEADFQQRATHKTDQPITTSSEEFSADNYGLVAYHKTAAWLRALEQRLGRDSFRNMMQDYFQQWKFQHPQPQDFTASVGKRLGADSTSFLHLLNTTGILPGNRLSGNKVMIPFAKGAIKNYFLKPTANVVMVSPAFGFNSYDKLMVGALVTNYGSPISKLNYLAIPMVGLGSKNLVGLGKINYAAYSRGPIRRADFFLNASTFTVDEFKDDQDQKYQLRFAKLVPGLRLSFRERDARSMAQKYIQWKTFFFNEQALRISLDSIITPVDTTIQFKYNTPTTNRYLNQLRFGYRDLRALYPFDMVLQVEQAKEFVRTTFTANHFFNYAKGGGLAVRLFAGKFSYLGERTIQQQFATDRYHLNMTGANGYEDYTYSDYFVGRNKFEGLASQQIMMRDGGFKVRTDLLSSKVGKTDDWLTAINLVTTIPQKINPLSVLPVKIPLRLFADVGTYAEAWDRDANLDRILFDFGLQIPLFDEAINIYIPLVYSKVYSDYFKSTIPNNRFFKTISFSINPFTKSLQKLHQKFDF